MAASRSLARGIPRLNPFLFPSDTDFRFVLLIVSVLSSSLFAFNLLYFRLLGEDTKQAMLQCFEAYPLDESLDIEGRFERLAARGRCLESLERRQAAWLLAGAAAVLLVAALIYRVTPALKIRRGRLKRLSARDAPEVVVYLADLYREAGLRRSPKYLWNPLDPRISGLAFGCLERYYVALTGGLITQFYVDRPAFRAVVLHELAHLRNADVDKTYFTVALWQAYVAVVLIPLSVFAIEFLPRDPLQTFHIAWRMLALVGLVYLMRNAILRARELYADVRASVWDGPSGALGRVIATLLRPVRRRWLARLGTHPHPDSRLHILAETQRLFPLHFWDAVGTGIATTIAFVELESLINLSLPALQTLWSPFLTTRLFAPLVVGVIGVGVWRAVFAALVRDERPSGLGQAGLGLGLGFIAGQLLALDSGLTDITPSVEWMESVLSFAAISVWGVVLLASLFLFVRWMTASASLWLEVARTWSRLRAITVLGLMITTGVLTVWLTPLFFLRNMINIEGSATTLGTVLSDVGSTFLFISNSWLTLVMLASLWSFPLAVWFWREQIAPLPSRSWAYLDPLPQAGMPASRTPLRPLLALTLGVISGLLYCGLVLAARIGLRVFLSEATRSTDQFILTFYFGQIAVASLMQAGTAAIVAAWVRRVGALHGLFAAFIAGCIMAVGVLGLNLLFGGGIDLGFAWNTFAFIVNGGALLALPVGLVVATLAAWLRRWLVPNRFARAQPNDRINSSHLVMQ